MALKETPYLKLPYGEGGDKGFREQYNTSMEKIDGIFHYPQSIKYPEVRQSVFESSFITPTPRRFELRPELSRYVQLGNLVFFEVALENVIDIPVKGNGYIGYEIVGTLSPSFDRIRGFYCVAINGIAASYSLVRRAPDTQIRVHAFGGMAIGKTVPKGTYFGIAGHYMLTN